MKKTSLTSSPPKFETPSTQLCLLCAFSGLQYLSLKVCGFDRRLDGKIFWPLQSSCCLMFLKLYDVLWNTLLYIHFVNYEKAFDSLDWLKLLRRPQKPVCLIHNKGMPCREIHSARETIQFCSSWLMTGSWSLLPAVRGIQWTLCGWPWAPVIIPAQHQQQSCLAWCCAAFMCLSSTMDKKMEQMVMWRPEKSSTFVRISSGAPRRSANTPSCVSLSTESWLLMQWRQEAPQDSQGRGQISKAYVSRGKIGLRYSFGHKLQKNKLIHIFN